MPAARLALALTLVLGFSSFSFASTDFSLNELLALQDLCRITQPAVLSFYFATGRCDALNAAAFCPTSTSGLSQYFAVDCQSSGVSLLGIRLIDVNTNGSLAPSIGGLSSLQELRFENCGLLGTIPDTIGDLNNLSTLVIRNNIELTGTVPISINQLKLQILDLTSNGLSGPLPNLSAANKTLQSIFLTSNSFSGTIPRSWSNFAALSEMYLDFNVGINGTLAAGFKNLTTFYSFGTSLSGTLPASLSKQNWTSLKLGALFSGCFLPNAQPMFCFLAPNVCTNGSSVNCTGFYQTCNSSMLQSCQTAITGLGVAESIAIPCTISADVPDTFKRTLTCSVYGDVVSLNGTGVVPGSTFAGSVIVGSRAVVNFTNVTTIYSNLSLEDSSTIGINGTIELSGNLIVTGNVAITVDGSNSSLGSVLTVGNCISTINNGSVTINVISLPPGNSESISLLQSSCGLNLSNINVNTDPSLACHDPVTQRDNSAVVVTFQINSCQKSTDPKSEKSLIPGLPQLSALLVVILVPLAAFIILGTVILVVAVPSIRRKVFPHRDRAKFKATQGMQKKKASDGTYFAL